MPAKRKRSRPATGGVSTTASSPKRPRPNTKRAKARPRSIWNSADDWDTLLSDSALSTSSISLRPPRLRGLHSLVRCSTDAISRGFKRLWESGEEPGQGMGEGFKVAWREVPEHLKEGIRDQVFKWWGGYLTLKMITEVFVVPPHLYLPGELLPSISKTERLKDLIPPLSERAKYTALTLTHGSSVSDVGVAGLIHHLPNLERINLKGCTAVSSRTIKTIVERCKGLKRVNLKGTKIGEKEVKLLLDAFGKQLLGFKVDNVVFEDINSTFSSSPFPNLTHLCLPGSFLNVPSSNFASRARNFGTQTTGYPVPRPTPEGSVIDWPTFAESFPALTHLYLPGLLIPPNTPINLNPGLIKFSLGTEGPAAPMATIVELLDGQTETLRAIHLGNLRPPTRSGSPFPSEYERLGTVLNECKKLEVFSLVGGRDKDAGGSSDRVAELGFSKYADLIYQEALRGNWQNSLKHLTLALPQTIYADEFFPAISLSTLGDSARDYPDDAHPEPGRVVFFMQEDAGSTVSLSAATSTATSTAAPSATPSVSPSTHNLLAQAPEGRAYRNRLETLELPSAVIDNTALLANALAGYKNLRSLDVSGTTITDDDMKVIIDGCPLLSRVDLTSCRGINVRHRRNIFQALASDK